MPGLPVLVHDGLEDGGEGRDPDAGADEDGVLGPEDVAGRGAVRAVDVDLPGGKARSRLQPILVTQ